MATSVTAIYVIGTAKGPKKVGLATNPVRRLAQLQTGHERPLALLYAQPVSREISADVERRAHWLLGGEKAHGEWFHVGLEAAKRAVDQALMDRGEGEKAAPAVGRKPLREGVKVRQAAVWLHDDLLARIKDIVGKQGFSEFMREAAERELKRRERAKPKTDEASEPQPPLPSPVKGED